MSKNLLNLQLQYGRALYEAEKWRVQANLLRSQIEEAAKSSAEEEVSEKQPKSVDPVKDIFLSSRDGKANAAPNPSKRVAKTPELSNVQAAHVLRRSEKVMRAMREKLAAHVNGGAR